jgi:pSer/pThr/pTyr-binding forkhead associated (FHA) protein
MTDPAATAARAWVLRTVGSEPAFTFRMGPGSERTVGRAASVDFVVDAPLVSRAHCRLTAHPAGQLEVEDLESTNGTFVNGRRITRATLRVGDRLSVGRVDLMVEQQ